MISRLAKTVSRVRLVSSGHDAILATIEDQHFVRHLVEHGRRHVERVDPCFHGLKHALSDLKEFRPHRNRVAVLDDLMISSMPVNDSGS